jgi:hypothetical protein
MSDTKGTKNDQEKPNMSLIVPQFIEAIGNVLTYGAKKYAPENWKNDLEQQRILSALYRHLIAYHKGEIYDPETDENNDLAQAPGRINRLASISSLKHPCKMVSIEPIMKFNTWFFTPELLQAGLEFVAVGYDNYNNGLHEPTLEQTETLIKKLEAAEITVYRKTIREAHQ